MSDYDMEDDMDRLFDDDAFEDAPTEEELREAMALARALDRGVADEPPEDALGAAALLRHAQDGGALDEARAEALFEQALREAKPPTVETKQPRVFAWLRWLVPTGAVALAAAAVLIFSGPRLGASSDPVQAARLPEPPTELLMAQLRAAGGGADEEGAAVREAEERAFGAYRSGVYAALEERYRP